MAPFKGTRVVTHHRSLPDVADRFSLDIVGQVEPRPGIPPSARHALEVSREMTRHRIKLILVEP